MKRVLVVGKNSFIASSFMKWADTAHPGEMSCDAISVRDDAWRELDLSGYDAILYAAGIVHRESADLNDEEKALYDRVNTQTPCEFAAAAKSAGVSQFIFISTMSVYPEDGRLTSENRITSETAECPESYYGISKLNAEIKLKDLVSDTFKVAIVRPPLVYGAGCRGKYVSLSKIAHIVPVFPEYDNARSMIFIDDLSEFFTQLIIRGDGGIYCPQNREPVSTSQLVRAIAKASGRRVRISRSLSFLVPLAAGFPGPVGRLAAKAFGSMTYDPAMSRFSGIDYQLTDFDESIHKTECVR